MTNSKLLTEFADIVQDIEDLADKKHLVPAICSHMKTALKNKHESIINAFVNSRFDKYKVCYLPGEFIRKVIKRPMFCHKYCLMQTASGYGRKLATEYVLLCDDSRERRVYAHCMSNTASLYVLIDNVRFYVNDWDLTNDQTGL